MAEKILRVGYVFVSRVGMGVRKDDEALKEQLNEVIIANRQEIRALLESYGVPLL